METQKMLVEITIPADMSDGELLEKIQELAQECAEAFWEGDEDFPSTLASEISDSCTVVSEDNWEIVSRE